LWQGQRQAKTVLVIPAVPSAVLSRLRNLCGLWILAVAWRLASCLDQGAHSGHSGRLLRVGGNTMKPKLINHAGFGGVSVIEARRA